MFYSSLQNEFIKVVLKSLEAFESNINCILASHFTTSAKLQSNCQHFLCNGICLNCFGQRRTTVRNAINVCTS